MANATIDYDDNILNEDTCIINDVPYEDINSLVFADKYLLVQLDTENSYFLRVTDEKFKSVYSRFPEPIDNCEIIRD